MKGKHKLRLQSAHLRYDLVFSRNITVIQGDSATGKTTLVDMIQEYLLNGSDTGIVLTCDCPCRVVAGNTWQEQLERIEDSLVFIDEGNRFISSVDFAEAVRDSSNYYIIVTREALDNLPYSVTEIYGIRSSGRYGVQEPVYHQMYRIYENDFAETPAIDMLVTEDSNAGFEFFSGIAAETDIPCKASSGAGGIFGLLQEMKEFDGITVIADGAAFGAQMGRIFQLMQRRHGIRIYLPESFEWLILSSGVLDDKEVRNILDKPEEYIDSTEYFSWERYFTDLLVAKSRGSWLQYSKSRLNPVYLKGKTKQQIIAVLPDDIRKELLQHSDSRH